MVARRRRRTASSGAVRAIDFHVHLPTTEWLDGSLAGYIEPAERYFRSSVVRRTIDELAAEYAALDIVAVLLAWDAETATGRPRIPNEVVADACERHPATFVGFGSVDPHKGEAAVAEVERIRALGLRGVKLHPTMQAFTPDDERHRPIFDACERLGLIALFHTGTSGIGAGLPGGQGLRLDPSRPIHLDAVAAAHPNLQVIAAHFGWPWHLELIAMALHKSNLYIDISGWAPRHVPAEVMRELSGRLRERFLFGSDYPFIRPERCLDELERMELGEEVMRRLLVDNGRHLLGLG
jgi:predicted TIM-barrel fold metal-dependent hydrolase